MKIFSESGFNPKGNVLPLEEFRLMRDWEELKLDPKKAEKVIAQGENILIWK